MSFVDPKRKYRFYRGETLVGMVVVVGSDQPYFCGHIDPTEDFGKIAHLLDRLAESGRQRSLPEVVGDSVQKGREKPTQQGIRVDR